MTNVGITEQESKELAETCQNRWTGLEEVIRQVLVEEKNPNADKFRQGKIMSSSQLFNKIYELKIDRHIVAEALEGAGLSIVARAYFGPETQPSSKRAREGTPPEEGNKVRAERQIRDLREELESVRTVYDARIEELREELASVHMVYDTKIKDLRDEIDSLRTTYESKLRESRDAMESQRVAYEEEIRRLRQQSTVRPPQITIATAPQPSEYVTKMMESSITGTELVNLAKNFNLVFPALCEELYNVLQENAPQSATHYQLGMIMSSDQLFKALYNGAIKRKYIAEAIDRAGLQKFGDPLMGYVPKYK